MEYPAKVLLAWGEAISGHSGLRDWLIKNGYPELGVFVFAMHHKEDARKWLLENGHPQLMAMLGGVEGDKRALQWLDDHGMGVLKHMALAGDGDEPAFQWLVDHGHKELAVIAMKINKVKREIDDDHNDPHKYSRD